MKCGIGKLIQSYYRKLACAQNWLETFLNFLTYFIRFDFNRPFTKDDMDLIYESYVIAKLQNSSSDGDKGKHKTDKKRKKFANNRSGELRGENRQLSALIPPIDATSLYQTAATIGTSVAGIMSFLSANSDVLTALGIVSQLEARAQYDPRFRNSIPRVIRDNAPEWIL